MVSLRWYPKGTLPVRTGIALHIHPFLTMGPASSADDHPHLRPLRL